MVLEVKELQDLAGVQSVGLGRPREDLPEPGELQVGDASQPVASLLDHPVQGAAVPGETFHRYRHRKTSLTAALFHSGEELGEAFLGMGDGKLIKDPAFR
ncbi:MAG: hypothetical protein NUV94_06155, partial [Candidatus Acetothermia bacterium]|nr:hypothetical protein [Candidatus Acetothermia bacterium]